MPKIANFNFNANFFNFYMKNKFGESFSHSSLAFEKVFTEGNLIAKDLKKFVSLENIEYALKLDSGTPEEKELYGQRFNEVKKALIYFGIPSKKEINENEFQVSISDFLEYIPGAIRPYRNQKELMEAFEKGELLGKEYEQETVLAKTQELFSLIGRKISCDNEARNLKKGNIDAFMHALSLKKIGISDIIEINSLVNMGTGNIKGFKKVNNYISGSSIKTCPKEIVSIKMQELLYKYENEWREAIPPFNDLTSASEEKDAYLRAICYREAKFHTEFERIHPFEDGNGRTGRILLNKNLIDNELAPILITPEMRDIYLKCIAKRDYDTFANLIYMLSSVELTTMVSEYRRAKKIDPDELVSLTKDDETVKKLLKKIE